MIKSIDCNISVSIFAEQALDGLGIPDGDYEFCYDYPLSTTATFVHPLTSKTTANEVLTLAVADYKAIYAAEDQSTTVEPGNIPGMLNRNKTDGEYGIWGHDMDDLYFEGVRIDCLKKTVNFLIGS